MLGTLTNVLSFHLNYLMKPILQSHLTEEKSKAHRSKNGASALVIRQPTATHSVFGTLATGVEREDHSGERGRGEVERLHFALERSEKGIQMPGCMAQMPSLS